MRGGSVWARITGEGVGKSVILTIGIIAGIYLASVVCWALFLSNWSLLAHCIFILAL